MILDVELKSKVIEVKRPSDRRIKLRLLLAGEILNIISAYAPQTGCTIEQKEEFYEDLGSKILQFKANKFLVVGGGDMNGHVGE